MWRLFVVPVLGLGRSLLGLGRSLLGGGRFLLGGGRFLLGGGSRFLVGCRVRFLALRVGLCRRFGLGGLGRRFGPVGAWCLRLGGGRRFGVGGGRRVRTRTVPGHRRADRGGFDRSRAAAAA